MQAHRYPEILEMIRTGKLEPQKMIGKTVSVEDSTAELVNLNRFDGVGVTVIGYE